MLRRVQIYLTCVKDGRTCFTFNDNLFLDIKKAYSGKTVKE